MKFYLPQDLKNLKYLKEEGANTASKSQLQDQKDGNYAVRDQLHIKWAKIGLYKIYYIVCSCGAMPESLLVAERGIRCCQCARLHSKEYFNSLKAKIHQQARFGGDKIRITKQPYG